MALLTPTLLGSGSSNTSATATATVTIPDYCLVIIDVENRHTTSASLGTVTLSGSTLGTIPLEATVTEGGASPTRRMTRFRLLSPTRLAGEVITATASGSQTGIALFVVLLPGAVPTGANGVNAVRQSVTGNSAGASVTTLASPLTLAAFGGSLNGAYAGFMATTGTATAKTAWTELTDTALVANVTYQGQYILGNDTTANSVQSGAGTMAGIVTEIVAVPNFATAVQGVGGSLPNPGYSLGSPPLVPGNRNTLAITVKAGRVNLFIFGGGGTGANIGWSFAFPVGVVGSMIYNAQHVVGGPTYAIFQLSTLGPFDILGQVTLDISATGSGNATATFAMLEIANEDTLAGIIQQVSTSTSTGGTATLTPAAFTSLQNSAIVIGVGSGGNTLPVIATQPGWQNVASVSGSPGVVAFMRPMAASVFTATTLHNNGDDLIMLEIAANPPNSPVVALVSPANGSTIAQGATITIDATDADGDLSTVAISANGETVTATGATLASPYTGGSISTITNGKRFVFPRTGGLAVGGLGVSGVATDSQGHTTPFWFSWTVAGAVTNPPAVALVSPPEGALQPLDSITVAVTDVDGDLTSILAIFAPSSEVGYSAGAFGASYIASSVQATLTGPNGFRLTFARAGGFPVGALSLMVQGTDALGAVTTRTYSWTVGIPESAGTTSTAGTAEPTGKDIWFDLASDGADRVVTPAGDWKLVDGDEALRQSLLRRLLTSPGEWARLPDYGCGARDYVNAPNTQANRDELANRIRAQFLRDYRVAKVEKVTVDLSRPGIVRMEIKVSSKTTPKTNTPITIAVGVG